MVIGIVGRKSGMTRIFTPEGVSVPVSVIEVEPNRITQLKTEESDGYCAVQVSAGQRSASKVSKAVAGHYSKAGSQAGRGLWEFRIDEMGSLKVGEEFGADVFSIGQKVDVVGVSKGKGFAGGVKRWNFRTQDASHGNSLSHRAPGSIGQCQTPGRVFKGKKMAGHLGAKRVTVQGLEIIKIDAERNLLLIKGGVPGATGSDVIVRPAKKSKLA